MGKVGKEDKKYQKNKQTNTDFGTQKQTLSRFHVRSVLSRPTLRASLPDGWMSTDRTPPLCWVSERGRNT